MIFPAAPSGQSAWLKPGNYLVWIAAGHGAVLLLPGDLAEDPPGTLGVVVAVVANLLRQAVQDQEIPIHISACPRKTLEIICLPKE